MNTKIGVLPGQVRAAGPRPRSALHLPAMLVACGVLLAACGQSSSEPPAATSQAVSLVGDDGDLTVTGPGTVINRYAVLAVDANAGATSITVTNVADLDDPSFGPLSAGDLVFVMQMQGASIDTSNSPAYGTITNLNGAGLHEFAVIRRIEGNTLHLTCSGLLNSYRISGRTQVVRVPQLSSLTIDSGGTIIAQAWDGQRGGIVVVHVAGSTNISGTIEVSGQGFRAGARDSFSSAPGTLITNYLANDPILGAEKGESIVGDAARYDALGGRYGRGAPANGGGGGNSHNAGGGGGSNGNNGSAWSGQGVMSSSVAGAAAWQLDPGYLANGNSLTSSSGGGRGGYSYSSTNQDALTVGPNNAAWGGDSRSEVGGLGGRPLDNDPASRLFLGGGGGAGDGNNNAGTAGGNGGGLVYLISSTVSGSGSINALGGNAENTVGTHNDAPGGGGGGGTVVIFSDTLTGISVRAHGGSGGNQLISTAEAEGPGGGGGGGYIALSGGSATASTTGGLAGTTTSTALAEFPVNGATFGGSGEVVTTPAVPQPWLACAPIDLSVTITNGQTTTLPGAASRYTVTVTNAGPATATNAPITVTLPTNASGATWTCTASAGASCQAPSGSGAVNTQVTLAPGATVTFLYDLTVSPTATGAAVVVTATAAEPTPGIDVNLADNTATDSDTLLIQADVSVVLVEPPEPALQGDPATYTVKVANAGPNTAGDVTVTFPVPAGSTFSGASGTGWTCTQAGGVVTCTLPALPPGGAPDISITVVPTIPGGTLNVSVSVSSTTPDPVLANNTDSASTTIVQPNDPPVNTVPAAQSTLEDTPLVFSTANGNTLATSDVDAGNAPVKVTLTVTQGTLTLGGTTGLTFNIGDGASDATMTFTGTLANVNAALGGLSFTPNAHYNGAATLTITTDDQGNTGVGGPMSDTDTVSITVRPVNDPPTAVNDTATVMVGSTNQSINVLANDTAAPDSGETLTIASVSPGSQGGTITITGGGTGISYTPPAGFLGTETFTYTISDGNGGTATATVTVTVIPLTDTDQDGIPDIIETSNGTDPMNPDSDDDGLPDGDEDPNHNGKVDEGETDPRDADTDDGGVSDGEEITNGTDPSQPTDDILRRVVGSGCSTSGTNGLPGALWLVLGLVGLTFGKRRASASWGSRALLALGAVGALAVSTPAQAQSGSAIDVQQFKPAPGKADVLGLHGAGVPGHLAWRAGLYLNYAHEPLVVLNARSETLLQHLVKNQLGFDLMGAVGLGDRFELGAVVPVNLQHGEFNEQPSGNLEQTWKGGLGDLRLVPKALLLNGENLRLGLVLPVVLPTGGATDLRGQKGIGAQPRLTADYVFEGGTRVLANVGINLRSREELLNLSVGNELSYGVGAAIPFQIKGQPLTGLASVAGAFGMGATGGTNEEEIPLEVQAGLQYHFSKHVQGTLGFGRGLTLGYGMPVVRVFSGFSYTADAPPPRPKDSDDDGLIDVEDKCSNEPEDMDGFEDEDGCPELDNDRDGIPDTADKCPLEPEDKDGFQDEDGCPDPDNDQDSFPDTADKCPLEAEDKDGFQDDDGCVDPDNDQDGILDTADKCPMRPEDKDGFQDEDGCDEPDNDKDGVADADDKCPTELETINGAEDTDGCPDKGEAKVKVQGNRILILEKVHFATNKDVVLARSFPLLQQVAGILRANTQLTKIHVEGHTDDRADDAFNMDLSQRRAENVRKYLVEQAGIDADRLEAHGYGETRPVDASKTAAGREKNRRVEFIIKEFADEE